MVEDQLSDIEITQDSDTSTAEEITSIPDLPTRRATLLERKDNVRRNLAYASLALLAITIIAMALFIAIADAERRDAWNDFLQIIIPVETLIIGGASAFYYNHKPKNPLPDSSMPSRHSLFCRPVLASD